MSDPVKDAWNEVAEGFSQLGHAMTDRYRGSDEGAGAGLGGLGASGEGLREALEKFVAAGRDVGQRAVDVVRDAEVNTQAKHAASTLNDALSATVDMIGREVAGWFARPAASPDEPAVVGVPPDVPEAARTSTTGRVTGPVEGAPDVNVADVDPDDGPTI